MQAQEFAQIFARHSKQLLQVTRQDVEIALATGVFKERLKTLGAKAEQLRKEPILSPPFSTFKLFDTNGNRIRYESDSDGYFVRRNRLGVFSTLVLLYEKPEDIAALEDILWAICDEYTWSLPAHLGGKSLERLESDGYTVDLFASETGASLAEITFLLKDLLSPIVVRRAEHLVRQRVIDSFVNTPWGWEHADNNWAAVCGDSVGTCAVYLEEDPQRLAAILERLQTAFTSFLHSFASDGGCLEGIGYWGYGFGHYVNYADLLYRRTDGEIDLFAPEIVAKVAQFPQKCFFAGGRTVSYSDGQSRGSWDLPCTAYLKSRLPGVEYPPMESAYAGFGSFIASVRSILWSRYIKQPQSLPAQCYMLPDAQWLICSSKNGVGFSAKGGHNNEPHNHNDIGGFLLYKNGEELFADLGSGEYTKEYFGKNRYDFFVCGSQGHSVPLPGGNTQKAGKEACATQVEITPTSLCMNIAPAYGLSQLPVLQRSFVFNQETGAVTLCDRFQFTESPLPVTERFIIPRTVRLQLLPDCVTLHAGSQQAVLHFDAGALCPSLHTETYSDHEGVPTPVQVLDFTAQSPEKETEYTFVIE